MPTESLSELDLEVLQLITDGKTNQQIAEYLELDYETIRTEIAGLLRRLGVTTRVQAALWYFCNCPA
jgi:NarL family two-component system response regulator LiaR